MSIVRVNWDGAVDGNGRAAFTHPYSNISDYVDALHWRVGSLGDVPTASIGGIDIDNQELEWVARQGRLSDGQYLGTHSVEVEIAGQPLIQCYGRFTKRSLIGDVKVMRMELFNSSRDTLQRRVLVNRDTQQSREVNTVNLEEELQTATRLAALPARGMRIPGGLWFHGTEANLLAALGQLWGGIWCDNGVGVLNFFRWRQFFENKNADGTISVSANFSPKTATIQDDPVWVPSDRWLANTQRLEGVRVSLNSDPPIVRPDPTGKPNRWVFEGSVNPLRAEGRGVLLGSGDITFQSASSPGEIVSLEKLPTFDERSFLVAGDPIGTAEDGSDIILDGEDAFSIFPDGLRVSAVNNGVTVTDQDDITGFNPAPEAARYIRARGVSPQQGASVSYPATYRYEWRGGVIRSAPRFIGQLTGEGGDVITDSIDRWGERQRRLPPWVDNNADTIRKLREDLSITANTFELAVVNIEIDEQSIGDIQGLTCGTLAIVNINGLPIVGVVAMLEYVIVSSKVPVLRASFLRPSGTVYGRYVPPTWDPPDPPPPLDPIEDEPVLDPPDDPEEEPDCSETMRPVDGECRLFRHRRSTVVCPTPGNALYPIRQQTLLRFDCRNATLGALVDADTAPTVPRAGVLNKLGGGEVQADHDPVILVSTLGPFPGDADNDIYVPPEDPQLARFSRDIRTFDTYGSPRLGSTTWVRLNDGSGYRRVHTDNVRQFTSPAGVRPSNTPAASFDQELWENSRLGDGFKASAFGNMMALYAASSVNSLSFRPADWTDPTPRNWSREGLTMFVLHDDHREFMRVGGDLGLRKGWRDDTTPEDDDISLKGSRVLDFGFVPTRPAPFDVDFFASGLTGGKSAELTIRFNSTSLYSSAQANGYGYRLDRQLTRPGGFVTQSPPGEWGCQFDRLKIATKVSFDIFAYKLTGGCDGDQVSSVNDLQTMDVEEEVLLQRLTLDLTEDERGASIPERFAALPVGALRVQQFRVAIPSAAPASPAMQRFLSSAASFKSPSKVLNIGNIFRSTLGVLTGRTNAVRFSLGTLKTGSGAVSILGTVTRAALLGFAAQAVIGGVVANWMIGEIGDALRDQSVQWSNRTAKVSFTFPSAGVWVVGMRATHPENISDKVKERIDATPFCTRWGGRSVAQTAAYVVHPSAFE